MDKKPFIPPPPSGLKKEEKVELPKRPGEISQPTEEVETQQEPLKEDSQKKKKSKVKKEYNDSGAIINYLGLALSIVAMAVCIFLLIKF